MSMMRLFLSKLPVLLLFPAFLFAHAEPRGGYEFIINGKPDDPYIYTVEGGAPSPGDVVFVENTPLCLDAPGIYRFEVKENIVRRILDDGRSVVVACTVEDHWKSGVSTPTRVNPLEQMDATALRALRGVALEVWPEGIAKRLDQLDMEHACISLGRDAVGSRTQVGLPALPEGTRTLLVHSGGTWKIEDMSGFARLKNLRFLHLQGASPEQFDFRVLEGLPLEYLGLPWTQQAEHIEALGSLTGLKTLVADGCSYFGGGWLAKLVNLRRLSVRYARMAEGTPPLDLAVLGGLPALETIEADGSAVGSLPETRMPALKKASLVLTGLPAAKIDAFAKANPGAEISRNMNDALSARLVRADRLLIRSGGTCHRNSKEEKPIYETKTAAEIAAIARHFAVDESQSGGMCMCCGNPTFEFYEGKRCIAMVGFHHGRSLRWADGPWPGDGVLVPASADFLVELLAKHGFSQPKEELAQGRVQEEAALRRRARYEALMPEAALHALKEAKSQEEATAAMEKNVPNVKERAALYLRLYGCDSGEWALASGLDEPLAETWLPGIPAETLREVILASEPASPEMQGGLRWAFGLAHAQEWKDAPASLERLARLALAHPRQANRWRTLAVLRDLGTPEAIALLRETMQHGTKPGKLREDEASEPGGMKTFFPHSITLPEKTPDSAAAALCLAMIGDQESQAAVERIRQGLSAKAQAEWARGMKQK